MKVALLDREGTIIVDPDHDRVDAPEKIRLLPHTIDALLYLASHDVAVVIVTNQTSIAQKRIDEAGFWSIHDAVLERLEPSGVDILKTYVCPHGTGDNCACRKPKPAMLLEAVEEFDLDPTETYMVGDRLSDIGAGTNAGMKTILVETGKRPVSSEDATYTAANLLEAAKYIVAN